MRSRQTPKSNAGVGAQRPAQGREGLGSALTHDGGVGAVGDAGDGVDAREHGADVVLVELDGVGVREEVVAVRGRRCPVGVCAPDSGTLKISTCSWQRMPTQDWLWGA